MRETAGETGRRMRSSCNNTDSQSGYAIFFMFSLSGCCLTTLSPDKDDWRDPPPLPMPGPGATRVRAEAEFVFLFETSHVNQALAIGTTNGIDVLRVLFIFGKNNATCALVQSPCPVWQLK